MESLQTNPSLEYLNGKITTRVLAAKLRENSLNELKMNYSSVYKSRNSLSPSKTRQSSRFLLGAAVPNSIIKSHLQNNEVLECEDKNILRAKRNAYVEEIINRMEQKMKSREEIATIEYVEEHEGRDKSLTQKNTAEKLSAESIGNRTPIMSKSATNTEKDFRQGLKEKERISRRTSILAPLRGERRSTYDTIKKAIENSKVIQQLIDVDNMEEERMKRNLSKRSLTNKSNIFSFLSLTTLQSNHPSSSVLQSNKEKKNILQKSAKTSLNALKKKLAQKSSKSILRSSSISLKPTRTVSIVECKKEDSQTQTYLNMNDFLPNH